MQEYAKALQPDEDDAVECDPIYGHCETWAQPPLATYVCEVEGDVIYARQAWPDYESSADPAPLLCGDDLMTEELEAWEEAAAQDLASFLDEIDG